MSESAPRGDRQRAVCAFPRVSAASIDFFFPNVIFRHKGFQRIHVTWSPDLNPQGIRVKMAQVLYETPELATTARDALDGFTLKKGWKMTVAFI